MGEKSHYRSKQDHQRKMAEAISYLMDAMESEVAVEILSDSCVFRIEGIEKGFVFGNDTDELTCAIEAVEFLATHREDE